MTNMVAFVELVSSAAIIPAGKNCNSASAWNWTGYDHNHSSYRLSKKMAYDFLLVEGMDTERWNTTWHRTDTNEQWQARWAKLWASDLAYQAKIFLWRVLAKGLFTGARAMLMGHADVICKECPEELETIPHLFEHCRHARRSWQAIQQQYVLGGHLLQHSSSLSLLDLIESCLFKNPRSTATLQLVYNVLWDLWPARNGHQFQGTPRYFSAILITQQAEDCLYAACASTKPGPKLQQLHAARKLLITSPEVQPVEEAPLEAQQLPAIISKGTRINELTLSTAGPAC
jgi:hypothetical protein